MPYNIFMSPQILTPQQLERLCCAQFDVEESHPGLDSPFLRLLASIERSQRSSLLSEVHCAPGEYLVCEGEPGDALYLIWSGRAAVYIGDIEAPTVLGYREPGEIIGEMALLENQPRSASVVALTDLRLLKISRQNFYNLLKTAPTVGMNIMEVLSARLRVSDQARKLGQSSERQLISQVSALETEKQQLLELQRLRQETSDLIIHDLRNPLGSISLALNMLEMMLPEDVLSANRAVLDVAHASSDRLMRLVEALLDVSRMEAGEAQFHFAPLDLPDLVTAVTGRMLIPAERQVTILKQFAPGLPLVMADRDKLERVLQNLLDNALKYTPDGGTVTAAVDLQGPEAVVSITDTGPGIPEDQRQRIFERFAQVAGDKRARRGFGLGLSYCRLAVEAHRGRIWAEPGPRGIGSRFAFTLPLKS